MLKKFILVTLFYFLLLAYLAFFSNDRIGLLQKKSFTELQDREKVEIVFVSADGTPKSDPFEVEVVNTSYSTTQGLSGRDSIGSAGMLFIFPDKQNRYFWMKDMKFNLDMVWISGGKVISITQNVPKPEPNTPDNRLQTYSANTGVDMVLELNAFDAEKLNIKSGDMVQLVN